MGTNLLKFAVIVFPALLASCGPNSDDIFARHCKIVVLANHIPEYEIFEFKMKEVQRYVPTDHPNVLVIEIKYSYRERNYEYEPPGLTGIDYNGVRCGYSIGKSVPQKINNLDLVYYAFDGTGDGTYAYTPQPVIINKKVAEWLAAHPQE